MAFDINNYAEKYYWEGADRHGFPVKLEILQKTTDPLTPLIIDGLTFIHLEIQGSQDEVTTPIVKTSLSFGLVDTPDLPCAVGHKNGNWQEFFTPDATGYLVRLYRRNSAQDEWAVEWSGYITPDSWQESLDYHGEITIVARDGLGFLENRAITNQYYDTSGVEWLDVIIGRLFGEVNIPMPLSLAPGLKLRIGESEHDIAYDACVEMYHLAGENAYETLERILDSIGYCIRYFGGNQFLYLPIRNLPLRGHASAAALTQKVVEFYNGDLTINPAVKSIVENADYEYEQESELPFNDAVDYGNRDTYSGRVKDSGGSYHAFTGLQWTISSRLYSVVGWKGGYGAFKLAETHQQQQSLTDQEGENYIDTSILIAADRVSAVSNCGFQLWIHDAQGVLKIRIGRPVELKTSTSPYVFARLKNEIKRVYMRITYLDPVTNTLYYYNLTKLITDNNPWQTTTDNIEATPTLESNEYSINIPFLSFSEDTGINPGGILTVYFDNIVTEGDDTPDYGSYAPIRGISFHQYNKALDKNKVTTVNSDDYNKVIERSPEFAPLSLEMPFINALVYKKALWSLDADYILHQLDYNASWSDQSESDALPLPAQIHRQLLMFGVRPFTVLNGDCYLKDKSSPFRFNLGLMYKGKRYVLISGTYDILESVINGAILHEFDYWEDLWENS